MASGSLVFSHVPSTFSRLPSYPPLLLLPLPNHYTFQCPRALIFREFIFVAVVFIKICFPPLKDEVTSVNSRILNLCLYPGLPQTPDSDASPYNASNLTRLYYTRTVSSCHHHEILLLLLDKPYLHHSSSSCTDQNLVIAHEVSLLPLLTSFQNVP